ncbi:MAG TPA: hypothetical protein VF669_14435 [Tepidisphaeraceae bacterium]|jgi:hypothetical protein
MDRLIASVVLVALTSVFVHVVSTGVPLVSAREPKYYPPTEKAREAAERLKALSQARAAGQKVPDVRVVEPR